MGWLARLFRYEKPPASALALLERDERLVAWGTADEGEAVLATNLGLWLPGEKERRSWHTIHKATWDREALRVVPGVEVEPDVVADGPPVSLPLLEPRNLPAEVRARVTRSVAHTSYHPLPGGGVWIVARRVPGVDGLTWVMRFDDGVDRDDPTIREAARALLEAARAG